MKLMERTLTDYLEELRSESPAPGGGSVSALAGAQGMSLLMMVCGLTITREKYAVHHETCKKALEKAEAIGRELAELVDLDTEAYLEVSAAFKLPKETEEEKAIRKKRVDSAKERVLEIPYQLVKESFDMYEALRIATEYGNKNAISDAGVAAILIHGAIEGAALNVFINLAGSEVNEENINLKAQTDDFVEKSRNLKEDIVAIVIDKIYGRQ